MLLHFHGTIEVTAWRSGSEMGLETKVLRQGKRSNETRTNKALVVLGILPSTAQNAFSRFLLR